MSARTRALHRCVICGEKNRNSIGREMLFAIAIILLKKAISFRLVMLVPLSVLQVTLYKSGDNELYRTLQNT